MWNVGEMRINVSSELRNFSASVIDFLAEGSFVVTSLEIDLRIAKECHKLRQIFSIFASVSLLRRKWTTLKTFFMFAADKNSSTAKSSNRKLKLWLSDEISWCIEYFPLNQRRTSQTLLDILMILDIISKRWKKIPCQDFTLIYCSLYFRSLRPKILLDLLWKDQQFDQQNI